MPTYDYECKNCGYKFEMFQKMTDEPIKKCPNCGENVKRLIGAGAGPIFKGKGFYQTDYKNPPKPVEKKEDAKTSKKESTESPKSKPDIKKD